MSNFCELWKLCCRYVVVVVKPKGISMGLSLSNGIYSTYTDPLCNLAPLRRLPCHQRGCRSPMWKRGRFSGICDKNRAPVPGEAPQNTFRPPGIFLGDQLWTFHQEPPQFQAGISAVCRRDADDRGQTRPDHQTLLPQDRAPPQGEGAATKVNPPSLWVTVCPKESKCPKTLNKHYPLWRLIDFWDEINFLLSRLFLENLCTWFGAYFPHYMKSSRYCPNTMVGVI